jgi:rubrerythrin
MEYEFDDKDNGLRDAEDDLEMLREDLIGELRAINQYQEHIESLESEEAAAALEHIIEEEKEHVAELLKLISFLDPVQAEKLSKQVWY